MKYKGKVKRAPDLDDQKSRIILLLLIHSVTLLTEQLLNPSWPLFHYLQVSGSNMICCLKSIKSMPICIILYCF